MTTSNQIGVLFVCLGNICRSPMAEAVFRHIIAQEGFSDRIVIDSAGTAGWHTGKPPHHGTRRILDQYEISYESMRARQVNEGDFSQFQYIVAMDSSNVEDLQLLRNHTNSSIIRLLDLIDARPDGNVPDPYYTGNFEETYDLVREGCRALLAHIREKEHF